MSRVGGLLLRKTAEKLKVTELGVFYTAARIRGDKHPAYEVQAKWMWDAYQRGSVPHMIEDFCLDVMAGRVKLKASA